MEYAKPEVVLVSTAIAVIHSTNLPGSKSGTPISDHQGLNEYVTNAAYDADE